MMPPGWPGDGTPSLESLRELRLRALLNDLVNDLGQAKAAEQLGIDRKTLWRSEGAGRMSERLAEALERMLLQRAVAAMEEDRETVRALEERVSELEGQLAETLASAGGGNGEDGAATDALRREFAQEIQRLERRLEGRGAAAPDAGSGGAGTVRAGAGAGAPRRYPDLVTREPADDDEQVYGAAWSLIDEWRKLWAGHSPLGKGLAWASRRERILELEVAMLEEHGLTLPPETAPLRGLDRGDQLNWRVRELAKVKRQRAGLVRLRWLRRVLTLGLWRR